MKGNWKNQLLDVAQSRDRATAVIKKWTDTLWIKQNVPIIMVLLLLFSEAQKADRLNLLHTESDCENQNEGESERKLGPEKINI